MRTRALAATVALTLMPAAASSQANEDGGAIRYIFPTLLVPDHPTERSLVVSKKDPWFTGKAVPVRAIALDADVPIDDYGITLPRGTVLSIARSDRLIGCPRDIIVTAGVGGMGRSPVCLVDVDLDGKFDGWFKGSIERVWGCCNGHLQRSRIRPINPVGATELSPDKVRALEPWGYFSIRYAQGMLTYCLGESDVCLQKAPRIKPTDSEQQTEFMGGLFGYRQQADGKLAVRIIRDPQEATY